MLLADSVPPRRRTITAPASRPSVLHHLTGWLDTAVSQCAGWKAIGTAFEVFSPLMASPTTKYKRISLEDDLDPDDSARNFPGCPRQTAEWPEQRAHWFSRLTFHCASSAETCVRTRASRTETAVKSVFVAHWARCRVRPDDPQVRLAR